MDIIKNLSTFLLPLFVVCISVDIAYSGSDTRGGTAGATELLVPVGSQGTAMSGAVNASVSGVEAIAWNPAGMARIPGSVELMFSNLNYIGDIKLNYFGVAASLGDVGTLGLTARSLSFGDIPVTTTDFPEGTGTTYSPSYITVGLTFARAFTDRIYGGATVKLINESIIRTSATGFAVDIGIQYVSGSSGLKLGVVLKNLGPKMVFSGQDMESFVEIPGQEPGARQRSLAVPGQQFDLPSTLEMGLGYDFEVAEQHKISIAGNFQNSNYGNDEYSIGLEYAWNNMLFLRGGTNRSQNQSDNIFGPTFGVGVKIPIGTSSVSFDYSYRKTDFFSGSQWITVKAGF